MNHKKIMRILFALIEAQRNLLEKNATKKNVVPFVRLSNNSLNNLPAFTAVKKSDLN